MSRTRLPHAGRETIAVGWLLGGAVLAYLLVWPRQIGHADESYLLDGARRIAQGQILYRDVFDCIAPGGYYLFAALFTLTGPSLLVARATIAVVDAVAAILLFRLARRVAGTLEAALAVLPLAVLAIPVWPFASPHWLSTCLALASAAALLAERWRDSDRMRPALAGLLAGLAVCVQQQRGVFLAAWLPLALLVLAATSPAPDRWRRLPGQTAWAAAAGAAVCAAVFGHAAWRASPAEVVYALVTFVRENYGPWTVGSTPWAGYIALSAGALAYTWHPLLRAAPLALVAEAAALAVASARGRSDPVRVCLLLLGVLMAASIVYFPDYIHVGFVLPFLLLPAAAAVHDVRVAVAARGRTLAVLSNAALAAGALALVVKGGRNLVRAERAAPERFASAVGLLRGEPGERHLLETVQRAMATRPDATDPFLFIYPVDTWLYLAVPGDNPTRYAAVLRGFHSPGQIAQAAADVDTRRTPVVVALERWLVQDDPVRQLLDRAYVAVEDVGPYRIYRRRTGT